MLFWKLRQKRDNLTKNVSENNIYKYKATKKAQIYMWL